MRSTTTTTTHGITKRTRLIRVLGRSLLGVIFLVALGMIICWLVVIPKSPRLIVETGKVIAHSSTISMLNATIAFTVKSYNPNKRASIHMDYMRMIVDNMGVRFSSAIPSFTLTPRNQTVLSSAVQVNFEYPFGYTEEINPELQFSAEVSYSIKKWMSKPRLLEIYCNHILLKINDSTAFDNTKCKVDF
ncbi:NDR1/HIN1-like protein 10 isoform X2 [Cucumis sativus]|uniref:Late embryogenesis abundant protein LEA-2 subgroup domain-containing protein n=1 Tax=Cucumis sativus TaxID=3659 RepID=A0A0A0LY09_CUCSA|nr:NDR1/HIN1-like protein 10 isoform X2 [Cucumis sativus]